MADQFIYNTVLQALKNEDGIVTDFSFTEIDSSFAQLLKPVAGNIKGELCSKVLSQIGASETDVLSTLISTLQERSTKATEIYSSALDRYFRIQVSGHSDSSVTALFVDSSAQKYLERQLIERRKEFKAVLLLSELNDIELPTREILRKLVLKIPESLQYPEHTYCRIKLNDEEIASENYRSSSRHLRREITEKGNKIGFIEVGYVKDVPELDRDTFLREEKELLDIIANSITEIVKNKSIYNKLHVSRALLDNASSLANLGAWDVDLKTMKSTWSDQVAKIHELPPGGAPGPAEGISYYEPEFRDRIADIFKRCAEEGIPYNEVMAIRTAKGNRRWVKTTGEPVRDETGTIIKVQGAFQDITDTVNVQEALRESEQKFRQIFYNHAAIKLIIDPKTAAIVFANSSAAKFYGWTVEELENMRISDINVLGADGVKQKMRNVQAEQSSHFEFKHRKADGSIRDVEVFTSKVMMDDHEYLHSIIHDITEKKKAEKALIDSEKMLSTMISASPLAIYRLSPDGIVESWNKAAEDIFGWSADEVIGKYLPIVPTDKQIEFEDLRKRVVSNDAFTGLVLKRQKKDGSDVYISLSTASLTDQSGKIISILSIASDITEKIHRDEQLQIQSKALNSAANAIIITDSNGNIEWINHAWTTLTGYQEEEVLGKNPRVLKSGRQDQSYYSELWKTILSGNVWEGEIVNKRKDGSLYHEYQTITPLLNNDGKVSRFIGIKQDITKRIKIENELRELLREKEILLLEVHHRVKNNMAILSAIMYLELIQTENRHLTDNIQKNINRIDTIGSIHELVYDSEKWAKINLGEILSRITKFGGEIDENGCSVNTLIEANEIFINVNQALPTSLIINEVVTGICKAATKKNINITLKIKASEIQNKFEITISVICKESPSDLCEMIEPLEKQLIYTLTQQLKGDISFKMDKMVLRFERDDAMTGAVNHFL